MSLWGHCIDLFLTWQALHFWLGNAFVSYLAVPSFLKWNTAIRSHRHHRVSELCPDPEWINKQLSLCDFSEHDCMLGEIRRMQLRRGCDAKNCSENAETTNTNRLNVQLCGFSSRWIPWYPSWFIAWFLALVCLRFGASVSWCFIS